MGCDYNGLTSEECHKLMRSKLGKCSCGAPIRDGKFSPPDVEIQEAVMVDVLKKHPDLIAEAVFWSQRRNGALWNTLKDIIDLDVIERRRGCWS